MYSIRAKGFTLVELMTVIGIVAIMAAIAFPNFTSTMRSNRVATSSNELLATLALARSEAVRSGGGGVCASDNGTGCSGDDWNAGWIVWTDGNGNRVKDGDEPVIRYVEGNPKLLVTSSTGTMTFDVRGRIREGEQTIDITPDDAKPDDEDIFKRCVYISPTGQTRVAKESCP